MLMIYINDAHESEIAQKKDQNDRPATIAGIGPDFFIMSLFKNLFGVGLSIHRGFLRLLKQVGMQRHLFADSFQKNRKKK